MIDPKKVYITQKLICIKHLDFPTWGGYTGVPKVGEIYTVRDLILLNSGIYSLLLQEIKADISPENGFEYGFGLSVFDYHYSGTDISQLKNFLNMTKKEIATFEKADKIREKKGVEPIALTKSGFKVI